MEPCLALLPDELKCSIIRLLDPIGLISLSQTSTRFRRLIRPTRAHFLERLLALECEPAVGGTPYVLIAHGFILEPFWTSPEWASMRFACAGCMKLLPHTSFGNQALLRLGYRKPFPSCEAAHPVTSWEPSLHGKRWGRRYRDRREEARQSAMRQRYAHTIGQDWRSYQFATREIKQPFLNPGMPATPSHDHCTPDAEAWVIELKRCGSKRHLRLCNECRFQRGHIQPLYGSRIESPIVLTRTNKFPTNIDRWMPGIEELTGTYKRPDFDGRVYWDYPASLSMARCSSCTRWQELRAFREEATHFSGEDKSRRNWSGRLDGMYDLWCNHCVAENKGRHALGEALVAWLRKLLLHEMRRVPLLLLRWHPKPWLLEYAKRNSFSSGGTDGSQFTDLQHRIAYLVALRKTDWSRDDVKLLGEVRQYWTDVLRCEGEGNEDKVRASRNLALLERQEAYENWWFWLRGLWEDAESKEEVLVEWALARDGTALT